tara:strand:- start:318 stop:743 length:426 start_codon:yes stop_codon:yes gene_type:complete
VAIDNIFGIAGTALNAQLTRMNLTASNLANSGTKSSTPEGAFHAKRPVFKALLDKEDTHAGAPFVGGVKIDKIVDIKEPIRKVYDPFDPQADSEGFVYTTNISEVVEMVEMMAAARSYQNNVEVVNTARELMMRTIDITKA